MCERFGMLPMKDDQLAKSCVTSVFSGNVHAKRMVGGKVPEIEREGLKARDLFEQYVFWPKGMRITRFVGDFLPGSDGLLYFLQVKYFDCEKRVSHDVSRVRQMKVAKGLDASEWPCKGIFCGRVSGSFAMQELMMYLMVEGHLSKKWVRTGVYLVSNKLISDYDDELRKYKRETGTKNALAPLVDCSDPFPPKRQVVSLRNSFEDNCGSDEYDPKHVCELCHRVYKLYKNKRQMLLQCNTQLCLRLKALAEKRLESWTSADIKFLLEVYGHTLPPLLQRSQTPRIRRKRASASETEYYHYGYDAIMEAKLGQQRSPGEKRTVVLGGIDRRKNYMAENIRSVYRKNSSRPGRMAAEKSESKPSPQETKERCVSLPRVIMPRDMLAQYRMAERYQRNLVRRLRASIDRVGLK